MLAWARIVTAHKVCETNEATACTMRALCQANKEASSRGDSARGSVEVGTFILLSHLPTWASKDTEGLLMSARLGRASTGVQMESDDICGRVYEDCTNEKWESIRELSQELWRRNSYKI